MNIIDAVKSGKRYYRKGSDFFYGTVNLSDTRKIQYRHDLDDILATDWEIEIVKKELSAEDIKMVMNRINCNPGAHLHQIHLSELLKQLGLE